MHPFDEPTKAPAVDHDQIVSPEPNPDAAELIENAMDAASLANERKDDTSCDGEHIPENVEIDFTKNTVLLSARCENCGESLSAHVEPDGWFCLDPGAPLAEKEPDTTLPFVLNMSGYQAVQAVRDRLFTENRLNADEMRDLAESLRLALEGGAVLTEADVDRLCETPGKAELYEIGRRHGKTPAEVDAFLAKK
jgi:hypothetical protein